MHERKRLDLRVNPEQRAAIEQAASNANMTITQFILDTLKTRIPDFPLSGKKQHTKE